MIKNILFDLDGTLTDSQLGIFRCFEYAMDALSRPCPPRSEMEQLIGPPLSVGFEQLLASDDQALINRAIKLYRQRFGVKGMYENKVYEGVEELLDHLQTYKINCYVATSKAQHFASRIVDHFQLSPYFKAIYGAQPDYSSSEKTELLRTLVADQGLNANQTMMVGDRRFDMEAAVNNQITPMGALWGYGSKEELHQAGARYVATSPKEMVGLLENI